MAQKSEARKHRDAVKAEQVNSLKSEGRKGWDEVAKVREGCIAGLIIPTIFKDYLKNMKLMAFLSQEERNELAASVRLLESDLMSMLAKLKVISAKHAGKTGREKDYNEVFESYEVVNEYAAWQTEYDAFILPTKGDILQHISNAEGRQHNATLAELQRQQAAKAAEAAPETAKEI